MNEFCAQAANALVQKAGAMVQEKGLDRPTPLQSTGISEKAVAERFSKAAPRYDKLAAIQHTIAQHGLHNLPAQLVGNAIDE